MHVCVCMCVYLQIKFYLKFTKKILLTLTRIYLPFYIFLCQVQNKKLTKAFVSARYLFYFSLLLKHTHVHAYVRKKRNKKHFKCCTFKLISDGI